jgi:hypothetical protein
VGTGLSEENAASNFRAEDGGSIFLENADIRVEYCTVTTALMTQVLVSQIYNQSPNVLVRNIQHASAVAKCKAMLKVKAFAFERLPAAGCSLQTAP